MNLDFSRLKRFNINGTELIKLSIGAYKNLIPSSIDTDGSIFNGCGYIDGYRLSSSGAIKAQENTITTGFIPYTQNCIITMGGTEFTKGHSNGYHYLVFFDKNFKKLCHLQLFFDNIGGYSVSASGSPAIDASTSTISVDEFYYTTIKLTFNASTSNIAYFRINGNGNASSMIVSTSDKTIDTYNWKRHFVNLVSSSIDTDGSIYNGCGYINGYALKSTSVTEYPVLTMQTNTITTGYIPMTKADKIRMSGVSWIPTESGHQYSIDFYDENFVCLACIYHFGGKTTDRGITNILEFNSTDFTQNDNNASTNYITVDSNGVITFNFTYNSSANFRYIRISAGDIGSDMIVTKNEEIV